MIKYEIIKCGMTDQEIIDFQKQVIELGYVPPFSGEDIVDKPKPKMIYEWTTDVI